VLDPASLPASPVSNTERPPQAEATPITPHTTVTLIGSNQTMLFE
jgi:hypothetical protein